MSEDNEKLLASYKFCLEVLERQNREAIEIIKARIRELEERRPNPDNP